MTRNTFEGNFDTKIYQYSWWNELSRYRNARRSCRCVASNGLITQQPTGDVSTLFAAVVNHRRSTGLTDNARAMTSAFRTEVRGWWSRHGFPKSTIRAAS